MSTTPAAFFPPPAADPDSLDAKHRLADALRGLVEAVAVVDSAAGREALDQVTAMVEAARAALSPLAELPPTGQAWPEGENLPPELGPTLGRSNAAAAPLHLDVADGRAIGWAVYGRAYDGSIGNVHGGVLVSALMDVLACTQMMAGAPASIGTLNVRFRGVTGVGQRVDYETRLDRVEDRKTFITGLARCGDSVVCEAEAIFIAPRPPN
jgi:hypothetical protein